jgi:putative ABC transport system substrate-binding protein
MKTARRIQLLLVGLLIVLVTSASYGDTSTARKRILVIKSRDIAFYNPTLDGFVQGLQSRGYYNPGTMDLKVIALTGDIDKDMQAVKDQLSKSNSLVFTLGNDAAVDVQTVKTTTPCLFSMILDPVSLGIANSLTSPGQNFTGTTLLVSPGKQLEALQEVASQVKKIGVLYTDGDATSIAFLADAAQDASRLNMQIVSVPISSYDTNGRQSLLQLVGQVDAFWLIVDPASAGPQALTDTLDIAKKHNLPVLGMSSANVRSGALLSLSADLKDLGDVDAEMAGPLLDGSSTASHMPVRGPRQTLLSINLGTAKSLGDTIPDSVLHLADEVIDDASTPGGH